jgi:N-acyl-D-amino-acid deacylase
LAQPLLNGTAFEVGASEPRTLLKNGLLVDGSGKKGIVGDLLIEGGTIVEMGPGPIDLKCETLDCTGKVVAPGFIDVHSHMDWVVPLEGHAELKSPFTAQGCTTFIAGNCGYSPGGFRRNSPHKAAINLAGDRGFDLTWDTMEAYFDHVRQVGLSHNVVNLVGHGTTRGSMRGFGSHPMSGDEMKELLALLEEAMDHGASGVSLGLQYAPGIFASLDEVTAVARLVAEKDKLLTVHGRAYSSVSGAYKLDLLGTPHNVLALEEMINVAKETGVRLQYSHLMFAGTASHATCGQCLEVIDKAIADGVDVMTDTYPYHCGSSVINVVLPPWFQANLPENYHNEAALKRLEGELMAMSALLGFGYDDIQVTYARHPDFNQYNGLRLSEIAEKRGVSPFRAAMEISEHSGGRARVLNHDYSNMDVIDALMKHPACLFMTDSVVMPEGVQNPASFGAFPLLLQYARDRNLLTVEEAVRKMTAASAARVKVTDRGMLKPRLAADITVFDWDAIKDNNTVADTDNAPTGIEAVFINGRRVLSNGHVDASANTGVVLRG